jgi:murein DD-endopeptidase MepM/ murein hydrolase activator NlpD
MGPVLRITVAALLALAMMSPPAAYAATLEQLKAQRAKIQADLNTVGLAYRKSLYRLDDNEEQVASLRKQSKKTAARLVVAQRNLKTRCRYMYLTSDSDFVDVLLSATTFRDLVTRMDFLTSIANRNAAQIDEVKTLSKQLSEERAALVRKRTALQANSEELRARERSLNSSLASKKAEYARVRAALTAAVAARSGSPNRGFLPAGPNGMVFPVDGPNSYDDTWGAPRSGGRSHKGTDIMASRGTPCVAVLSGTVSSKSGGLGGKVIWLTADNGWRFYYAHLNGWAVSSGRVQAGQLIGYVGNTGNASGGACHLHFEIHPGGGAVNPYSYLRRMQ